MKIIISLLIIISSISPSYSFDLDAVFNKNNKQIKNDIKNPVLPKPENTPYKQALNKAKILKKHFYDLNFYEIDEIINEAKIQDLAPWSKDKLYSAYIDLLISELKTENKFKKDGQIKLANKWIEQFPKSSNAYAFRGSLYADMGWETRGHKYISEVPKNKITKMKKYFDLAQKDYIRSLSLSQYQNHHSWVKLLSISKNFASKNHLEKTFYKAVRHVPDYYPIYKTYINTLAPKWGGSIKELRDFRDKYAYREYSNLLMSQILLETEILIQEHKKESDQIFDMDHITNNKEEEIKKITQKIINKYPEYTGIYHNYAKLLWSLEEKEKSLILYNKAIETDIHYVGSATTYWVAEWYIYLNHHHEGYSLYEKYVYNFPHITDNKKLSFASESAAWYFTEQGDYKRAEPYYTLTAYLNPRSAKHRSNYCNALYNTSKLNEAIKQCQKALEINPNHPWSHYIMSLIYQSKGDNKKYREYNKKYKELEKK